jgi:hypothetical protein
MWHLLMMRLNVTLRAILMTTPDSAVISLEMLMATLNGKVIQRVLVTHLALSRPSTVVLKARPPAEPSSDAMLDPLGLLAFLTDTLLY